MGLIHGYIRQTDNEDIGNTRGKYLIDTYMIHMFKYPLLQDIADYILF